MIAEVLAFLAGFTASLFFWPAFVVAFVVFWALTEREEIGGAVFMTGVVGLLAYMKFPQFFEPLLHPMTLGIIAVSYIVIGVIWASAKWVMLVKGVYRKFIDLRDNYLEKHHLPAGYFSAEVEIPGELKVRYGRDPKKSDSDLVNHHIAFGEIVKDKLSHGLSVTECHTAQQVRDAVIPKIRDNKLRYTMWGLYWPTSIVWFVCNDFVRELANAIYDKVSGSMQRIANSIFSDAL